MSGEWANDSKSVSIKGTGCKSGGCALKMVELTSGGLWHVKGHLDYSEDARGMAAQTAQTQGGKTPECVSGCENFRVDQELAFHSQDQVGESWNATSLEMESWISVPPVALLEILSSPPILEARSRIPVRPQCPFRPV